MNGMNNCVTLRKPLELWIPYFVAQFKLSLAESAQLSPLHLFFLSAISQNNASENDLIDATKLSPIVIKQEMQQMCQQKLLDIKDEDSYILTELSNRLLHYQDLTIQMDHMNIPFMLNCVTGEISVANQSALMDIPEGVTANKIYSRSQLAWIEPIEIKDALLVAFPFLCDEKEEYVNDFLDSLIIEVVYQQNENPLKWRKMYVTELPLYPYELLTDSLQTDSFQNLKMCMYFHKLEYRIYDEFFENNVEIIRHLQELQSFDDLLLSEKANEILDRWTAYLQKRNHAVILYVDPISGLVYDEVCQKCLDGVKQSRTSVFSLIDYQISIDYINIASQKITEYDVNGFQYKLENDSLVFF